MHRIQGENVDETSGVPLFRTSPPYTTITPEWVNSVQEEIMHVVTQAGLPLLSQNTDSRTQLYDAINTLLTASGTKYDTIVASQQQFADVIERTAANTYKFKAEYTAVYFKYLLGGYSIQGVLSGGDTWGDLYTNNVTTFDMQAGAYFNFGDNDGNITVDTTDCHLKGVDVRGLNLAAAGCTESFYLQADNVTFDNCKTSDRQANVAFNGFLAPLAPASYARTSRFINCQVHDVSTTTAFDLLFGFYRCENLTNCYVYDIDSGDHVVGFQDCIALSNCRVHNLDSSGSGDPVSGFHSCKSLSNCIAEQLDGTGNGLVAGFKSCDELTACRAEDLDGGATGLAVGFYQCDRLSSCYASDIDTTGATATARGFEQCYNISACRADDITSAGYYAQGFSNSGAISGCRVDGVYSNYNNASVVASGYDNCWGLAGCRAELVVAQNAGSGDAVCFNAGTTYAGVTAQSATSNGGTARGFRNNDHVSSAVDNVGNPTGNTLQDDVGTQYSSDNI